MKRWIEIFFLRFYAANLMRARRAEPVVACRDAINQLGVVAAGVIVNVIAILALLASPAWLDHPYVRDWKFLLVCLVPGLAFTVWSKHAFSRFAETPEAADRYRSRAAVRLSNVLYLVSPVALIVTFGVLLRVLDPPS